MTARWEKKLETVVDVAERVANARKAVAKLKKGENSAALKVLVAAAEQALRIAIAVGIKKLRQRRRARDSSGKFR